RADLRFPMYHHAFADCNGIYHVSFRVKAKSGSPRLRVTLERLAGSVKVHAAELANAPRALKIFDKNRDGTMP
ncbi:MAG: hypothetical protein U9R68_02280, partial [Planctomycetota bacterium]|nr:hypothetical protein [Planctomycetota bacterium]